jgi:cytochrome c oxidase cbb3-type subunit 2
MNNGLLLFLGIFFSVGLSWLSLLVGNQVNPDFGGLQPFSDQNTGVVVPTLMPGLARQGEQVYQDLGCVNCHTQQVRREGVGADIERGWGQRQSVSRDYISQRQVFLGSSRIGPDLRNVGERLPSAEWHHHHLINPQINTPGSIMPAHAFLYETRKIVGQPSSDRLTLPGELAPPEGYEVVPTWRAKALVAYLLNLKTNYELPEARASHE